MIHIFGDSHAHFNFRRLAFEHLNHYVNGLTLHRIGRDGRECVDFRGAGVADGDLVLYQAGEVDCRCHIGKQVLRGAAAGATIDALAQALLASIRANLQAYRGVLVGCAACRRRWTRRTTKACTGRSPTSSPSSAATRSGSATRWP